MTTLTFDEVLTNARQLEPHERARLVVIVMGELVARPEQKFWSWTQMEAFITDFHRTYPDTDPAAQVIADRRARDRVTDAHD